MNAFGEGYKLPTKGKKRRSRRLDPQHETNKEADRDDASSHNLLEQSKTSSPTPPRGVSKKTSSLSAPRSRRKPPHPPSEDDSDDIDLGLMSESTREPAAHKLSQHDLMNAMMNEIDDDELGYSNLGTPNLRRHEAHRREEKEEDTNISIQERNMPVDKSSESNGKRKMAENDNDDSDNFNGRIMRSTSEEFRGQFQAYSAGRFRSNSNSNLSDKGEEKHGSETLSTKDGRYENNGKLKRGSILSRIGKNLKNRKGKKKKKKKKKKEKKNKKTAKKQKDRTSKDDHSAQESDESDTSSGSEYDSYGEADSTPRSRWSQMTDSEGKSADRALWRQQVEDQARTRSWLRTPLRLGQKQVQCYVIRKKSSALSREYPLFQVYLEETNEFAMAAQKRLNNKTSNYLITMDKESVDRCSNLVVGKLRSNFTGSCYHVYDQGMDTKSAVTDSSLREELGLVLFDYDKMGPGKMTIVLPQPGDVWKPREEEERLLVRYRESARNSDVGVKETLDEAGFSQSVKGAEEKKFIIGCNKRPKWDEKAGGHTLNFRGRVTEKSVKNFQIKCDVTGNETVLQFGRVGKHRFTMDFGYPFSPLQAFAICLASMDRKVVDSTSIHGIRKGVDKISKGFSSLGKKFRKGKAGPSANWDGASSDSGSNASDEGSQESRERKESTGRNGYEIDDVRSNDEEEGRERALHSNPTTAKTSKNRRFSMKNLFRPSKRNSSDLDTSTAKPYDASGRLDSNLDSKPGVQTKTDKSLGDVAIRSDSDEDEPPPRPARPNRK